MSDQEIRAAVAAALATLPDETGGIAIVLATSGTPPAMALLSTGDVHLDGAEIRIGIHASSSAVARLGGSFTLLVPLGLTSVRIEADDPRVTVADPLARITGNVVSMKPTAEPPWTLEMRFRAQPPDDASIPRYVSYWRDVKSWLSSDRGEPPRLPN
jgi:hypothetical protein